MRNVNFLKMRVSEIRVKRIRVNQGLGVYHCHKPGFRPKMAISRGQEWGREATPTSISIFDSYDIKTLWFEFGHDILNLHWLQNAKTFKLGCPFFSHFMKWNWKPLSLKCWHFEASEDIMTKFRSQGLHIIRIKYWNASGSGFPPSIPPSGT